jgi:hypothetical protein
MPAPQKAAREFENPDTAMEVLWKGPIREGDHEEHGELAKQLTP